MYTTVETLNTISNEVHQKIHNLWNEVSIIYLLIITVIITLFM
jgi:hypothetical protein